MKYWSWNAGLSAAEIRELVLMGVLERSNQLAAGPHCSLLAEVQRVDRRVLPDRRLSKGGWQPLEERRDRVDRRRYGLVQASQSSSISMP
ncbi:MAG: hypothetical protein R6W06_15390 [Prochlorococcaceae cyanobacterium]